jgi:hypothetical protein
MENDDMDTQAIDLWSTAAIIWQVHFHEHVLGQNAMYCEENYRDDMLKIYEPDEPRKLRLQVQDQLEQKQLPFHYDQIMSWLSFYPEQRKYRLADRDHLARQETWYDFYVSENQVVDREMKQLLKHRNSRIAVNVVLMYEFLLPRTPTFISDIYLLFLHCLTLVLHGAARVCENHDTAMLKVYGDIISRQKVFPEFLQLKGKYLDTQFNHELNRRNKEKLLKLVNYQLAPHLTAFPSLEQAGFPLPAIQTTLKEVKIHKPVPGILLLSCWEVE